MNAQALGPRACVGYLLFLSTTTLLAQTLDIHGSMAQGYVSSEGNNVYGSSLNGSRDLYEVVINGRSLITPKLLASGQLMARRAGAEGDGRLRVDYAQLDYQFFTGLHGDAGGRIGRLKNPYGLFNDSRDVVFSRPGITMPSAVYFEGVGFRNLFFSSDSAQLYGHWTNGQYASDVVIGSSKKSDVTDDFKNILGPQGLEGRVDIEHFHTVQWMHDWNAGQYRAGLSYLGAEIAFTPSDPQAAAAALTLEADIYVLSLQYQAERWSLSTEYAYAQSSVISPVQGATETTGDGIYAQYRMTLNQDWAGYLRYDLLFNDRNDRDGRAYASMTGQPRHNRFSRDHVIGLQWTATANWGFFLEYHYTDGTASVSASDNVGRQLERYWQSTYFMLAYQF